MKFKNFTPHHVVVFANDEVILKVPPEGTPVRVKEGLEPRQPIDGIPVVSKTYSGVEGLPAPEDGVMLIVSVLVLSALQGARPDVVAPDTGPNSAVRDEKGRILGVRGFQA